jgi:hypothetical protein
MLSSLLLYFWMGKICTDIKILLRVFHNYMNSEDQAASSSVASSSSYYANGTARFASQNVRDIGSQFQAKMSPKSNNPQPCKEGFAFEYLDAMDQQTRLGGKYKVEVPDLNSKNSPDIRIKSRVSGKVIQEQQLKRSAQSADRATKSGVYGEQEIRTPHSQGKQPQNSNVKESNVSASEVTKGANNPQQAVHEHQFKAAIAEISNAAAIGAITGAVASSLMSGLEHFLAVERGEIELSEAVTSVFLDTLQGAVLGGTASAAFAALPAFIPALIPVLNIISAPLAIAGGFQLINQIGQIIDRHEFIKRNMTLEHVHKQETEFFENRKKRVMDYLLS